MFRRQIKEDLEKVVENMEYENPDVVCSIPKSLNFGDYTSNIALQLANQKSDKAQQSPQVIANQISKKMKGLDYLEKVEVAGAGFINFFIKDESLLLNIPQVCNYSAFVNPEVELDSDKKRKVLVEFAHPNTHKQFHIGHLRNITLGESICRLLESAGNEVYRANYEGDIGLHVAKALWGLKRIKNEKDVEERQKLLGEAYARGSKAYDEDETAKDEIQAINKELYLKDPKILPLWKKTRQWSLDYFDLIYQKLGTKFNGFFFESEVEKKGMEIVRDNIGSPGETGKIFERDQGAIIFPGEKYGLHNRVFITSEGHPTYEAKDLGRAEAEKEAFDFDLALHVVAVDQSGYFQVMFKALEMVDPQFLGKNQHLAYGMVKLTSGKMASRTGEVVTFDFLADEVRKAVASVVKENEDLKGEEKEQVINTVSIGAIKFSMLKYSPQTDITFDIKKSVSLEGSSGPYLQYSYARAKSVLRTASYDYAPGAEASNLEKEERTILQKIEHFDTILEEATANYSPNTLAEYLLEFAHSFNLFYQKHPIIRSEEKMELRLALTCAAAVILKQGLYLLGIEAPERM